MPREIALGRVLREQALVTAVIGLAHGRLHADLRRDAGKDKLLRADPLQFVAEGGRIERALARLLDDDFTG